MLMKRTQIYIDPETLLEAKLIAKREGETLSHIARKALRDFVAKKKKPIKTKDSLKWLFEFSKKYPSLPGTPTDMSVNHDHYLYGTPKRKKVK